METTRLKGFKELAFGIIGVKPTKNIGNSRKAKSKLVNELLV